MTLTFMTITVFLLVFAVTVITKTPLRQYEISYVFEVCFDIDNMNDNEIQKLKNSIQNKLGYECKYEVNNNVLKCYLVFKQLEPNIYHKVRNAVIQELIR